MVYRHISKDLKERVLWLVSHEYAPEDICELFDISPSSIARWKQNNRFGSVIPPPNPMQCRPRILNGDMTHDLYTLLEEAPEMYLSEIQDWIAITYEVHISRSVLHLNIRDAGITYKLLHRAAAERDEDFRQEWREGVNAHFTASQMVFVGETSKDEQTIYRHYGRSIAGSRATINANFVPGERYSMVAALSLDGYEAVCVVPGSIDGEEFLSFIVDDVLPKMNPYPQDKSILILDNCAIHKTRALREIVEGFGRVLLFLPPYSPDLNPIEESFSSVKHWIRKNWHRVQVAEYPEIALLESSAVVTAENSRGWFIM